MHDKERLEEIIHIFFKEFISKDLGKVDLASLSTLFVPKAVITKTCGPIPVAYSFSEFIEPRQKILTDGTLSKFSESAVTIRTEIFGDIAHSFVLYQKSGILSGKEFEEMGMKSVQFVRISGAWKISSLAWDDERPGIRFRP